MIMKWSLQFCLNEKGNQSNSIEKKVMGLFLKNLIAYSVIL